MEQSTRNCNGFDITHSVTRRGGVRVGDQEVVHELCEAGSGGGEGGARHFLHQMFH